MITQNAGQGAISEKERSGSLMKILDRPIRFLKLVKRLVVQVILHFLDASYDLFRYMRYSNSLLHSTRDRQKLESLLFFYYHKIEKSLALPEVKPVFGLGYIETLLDLMDQWRSLTDDESAVVFRGAYAALVCYRDHVGQSLTQVRPGLSQRIDKLLMDCQDARAISNIGGVIKLTRQDLEPACQMIDFDHFVRQRHSVRNFTERHIPDREIMQAVSLAERSPSVCNRQCWRVHVFTSAVDKAKVLKGQNGNTGFGHLADRVLLITADLRSFITSGERNQAYSDAGMFAMTLIYALQAQKIASCCLNLCLSYHEEIAFRRVCKIPGAEVPIMLIAIGYPPEDLQVAASARKSTEAVLSFRDLDAGSHH
jgi:nitroreductase